MSILYPVAANAEAALHAPLGYSARERGARDLAGEVVSFVTEAVGPAFETREAALDAYAGRLDDDRDGRRFTAPPEARWCVLRPVTPGDAKRRKLAKPVMKNGRRWAAPDPAAKPALWRLSVSYWRVGAVAAAESSALEAARRVRKGPQGDQLEARVLRQLAEQPMRAFKPQQPLDIGLFETRLPEAPHIVMPDE